jgi:hypothetical protein
MNVRRFRSSVVALTVALAGCGGGGGSTTPSSPGPGGTNPTPAPSVAPSVAPTPSALSCPLGNGTLDSQCSRRNPALQEELEGAIDRVVARRPALFNLNDTASAGVYRVVDPAGYHAAVVVELANAGFCANYDGFEIQVKNTNDFSEQYDILTSDNFVRRGAGAYRSTCTPASFPVDPAEFIASVRVAFYGFRCQDGVETPRNGAGELPLGCLGYVTATPKKRDGTDVDPRIHGPEITWTHRSGHEQVVIETDDATFNGFNRLVVPVRTGDWVLCATVRGVEGCLNGKVIP